MKLDVDDSDDDQSSTRPPYAGGARGQQRQEVPASVLRAGETAKAFFDILFDTENNEAKRERLNHFLNNDDLEGDGFVLFVTSRLNSVCRVCQ